jgi:dihydroorotate dehydrogenase
MFKIIRSILFILPAETAHYFTMNSLKVALKIPIISTLIKNAYKSKNDQSIQVAGISFPNKVGLAAGFDKNAKYLDVVSALGFGHVEIGTVTPLPQSGNEKPRLFRLVKDNAILNRMGFNNDGVEVIKQRLKTRPKDLIVGGNIGKNKITPNEKAMDDYLICFKELYPFVDYFTVNVSSPNTPGLRELQDRKPLTELLNSLIKKRKEFVSTNLSELPVFLKIAPDLSDEQLNDIVELCLETGIDGIVATNTTISREDLKTEKSIVDSLGAGGVSGKPLCKHSTEVIAYLSQKLGGKLPIIGVGGIMNKENAEEKINAGASLVQLYSGFIYKGPGLVKSIIN